MWSTFDEKWKDPILQLISGTYFTKKSFLPLGKWKNKILFQKNYNCYANVVHNGNTHGCAKFGHVIMNYAMDVAMTMGRCVEIHTSS